MKSLKRFFRWLFRIQPPIGSSWQLDCFGKFEPVVVLVIYAADGIVTIQKHSSCCGLMFDVIPLNRFNGAYDPVKIMVCGQEIKLAPNSVVMK